MPLPDFWRKIVKMTVKTSFFEVMSEVQKDSEDVSAGIGFFFKLSYFISFPAIWGQSWRGQLWPHPVQLGLNLQRWTIYLELFKNEIVSAKAIKNGDSKWLSGWLRGGQRGYYLSPGGSGIALNIKTYCLCRVDLTYFCSLQKTNKKTVRWEKSKQICLTSAYFVNIT